MKRNLIGALALFTLSAASADTVTDTVKMGTEGAYTPWNFIDDAGNLTGFEIELGNELCARAGLECEWVINEWDTILQNLVANNYDTIMAGMSITPSRQKSIDFTQGYFPPEPSRWVATADLGPDIDPAGTTIGVQGGTTQANWVNQHLGNVAMVKEYATLDASMADLNAGVIDLVLADSFYLVPFVDGNRLFFVGQDVLLGGGVGMGIRKTDTKLKAQFNAAIDLVKADGTLDALIAKYFQAGPFYGG